MEKSDVTFYVWKIVFNLPGLIFSLNGSSLGCGYEKRESLSKMLIDIQPPGSPSSHRDSIGLSLRQTGSKANSPGSGRLTPPITDASSRLFIGRSHLRSPRFFSSVHVG